MSRGHSTDASSEYSSQLTPPPPDSMAVERGLSATELDNKIVSILEEYLHICDIQVC